ncbi:MAG: peptidylprolyl isomerase, partial [Clostridia bacterium]|nr:peptidylprolyl isomerase [Clostridia bacterium]
LNQSIASLEEQLSSTQAGLTAAAKEKENLIAAQTALNEELKKTKASAAENEKALNADLDAAKQELTQTQTELASTQAAMEKAANEAAAAVTALEENNQVLSGELTALRDELTAETQKSAHLQEELDVQSAKPEALQNRLETVLHADTTQQEDLQSLASLILRSFQESLPAAVEGETARPVAISVLIDGKEILTVYYDMTEAQEAQAAEIVKNTNESQSLYQLDLNHEKTAAVVINGAVFNKQAYDIAYAEAFSANPSADKATLRQLTINAMVKTEVFREQAAALQIDPDAQDMESQLWDAVLKNVTVNEQSFAAILEKQQQEEDEILASDPEEYAHMLEAGQIASSSLPEGSRFVKQMIIPTDFSEMDDMKAEMAEKQKRYDEIFPILNGITPKSMSKDAFTKLEAEGNLLARQINQLNSDLKLLESNSNRAMKKAAELALQIKENPDSFDAIAATVQQDEKMPAVGYAVFQGGVSPSEEFVSAALTLKKQGDVSEPIKMADGYHVLYYSEELSKDSASIQAVQEALRQILLEEQRQTIKDSLLKQWLDSAKVDVHIE